MKFLILIALTLLSFSQLQAQTWFQIGAEWNYGMEYFTGMGPYQDHDRMRIVADTLVGGQQAKRIDYTDNWLGLYMSEFVYEDSGRVYAWRDSFWTKLYDFNLAVGDQWTYFLPFPEASTGADSVDFRVDSVSTGLYNGVSLKVQWVSVVNPPQGFIFSNFKLVERMGSEGFFFPVETGLIGPPYGILRCYEDSTVGLYDLQVAPACDYMGPTLNLEDAIAEQFSLEAHPNPASDRVRLQFPVAGTWEVALVDMQGRRVKEWKVEWGEEAELEVGAVPRGQYLLCARNGEGQGSVGRMQLK